MCWSYELPCATDSSLPAYSPCIPIDTMLCGAAHMLYKTQADRSVSGRKRERSQNNSWVWFVNVPCGLARMQLMQYLATNMMPLTEKILHRILLHIFLHKNLSFTWTQLWVRSQTYWRYFKIMCYNTNATSKYQVMNFLYITLLTPRFLKWPHVFWKICGPQPFCVHVIHPFKRSCENNEQSYMVCVD